MIRDKSVLNSFAKIAVSEFVGPTKTPLGEAVKKIAAQEALTPKQIEYVAAQANQEAWAHMFRHDKQASYDFPLADARRIVDELGVKTETPVINANDHDYLAAPISSKTAAFDPFKAMGVNEDMIKTSSATERKELRGQLQYRFEKLSRVKEDIETEIYVNNTARENAELEFCKAARAELIQLPLDARLDGFKKIAEFVSLSPAREDIQRRLIRKLAYVLVKQGLMKESDLKAPEHYISKNMPGVKIVNGRHPLYVYIKTVQDRDDYGTDLSSRHEIVDSSLPVIKEKIREL